MYPISVSMVSISMVFKWKKLRDLSVITCFLIFAFFLIVSGISHADELGLRYTSQNGEWVAGDFHTHTWLTDGSRTQEDVALHAFSYGLTWMANSEHGGTSCRDPQGIPLDKDPNRKFLGDPVPCTITLADRSKETHSAMWRWQSLRDLSFPTIKSLREQFPQKLLMQGVEWNVPSHEHASVGIISSEPEAISDFEYTCDASDNDTSRANEGLAKMNKTHADAVACAAMLERSHPSTSYFLINHPSRKLKYSVADIRDFNNAAPHVAFGIEGLPGHQKEPWRSGYGNDFGPDTFKARTYGGADYMVAKVGGLWDALLGEGRKFWVFVNSDFHSNADDTDFWPGQYAKSYIFVKGNDIQALIDGLYSGNSFAVHGDLIDALEFHVMSTGGYATMGETLSVKKGQPVEIFIAFKSPHVNNHGKIPQVDHIELIAGRVSGMAKPGTPGYSKDTNVSTKVIARFSRHDHNCTERGWCFITYTIKNVKRDIYLRLRGTNNRGLNVPNETDARGNPYMDDLKGPNNIEKAYDDLWFYSNPIFLKVQ
jgi:hypothetical protein